MAEMFFETQRGHVVLIGIQLASLQMPFKKALYTAARLGAKGVEIDARNMLPREQLGRTGLRQLRKMLEDLDLRICAIGFRTRHAYSVTDGLDRRVEATKKTLQLAYELGASVVINQIGQVPEPDTDPWRLLIEVLDDLGRHGQRVGALLAAETGTEDGKELAQLIKAVPNGGIGVNFAPGNLIINGFSPRDALKDLGLSILHVHAKDGVRDLAQGRGLEVPLGRGIADFPNLLGTLEEYNYQGYMTIEREQCQDPVAEISAAVDYLRTLNPGC